MPRKPVEPVVLPQGSIPPHPKGTTNNQTKAAAVERRRKAVELFAQAIPAREIQERLGLKNIKTVYRLLATESKLPGPMTDALRMVEGAKLDERERLQRSMLVQQMTWEARPVIVDGQDTGKTRRTQIISPKVLAQFDQAMDRIASHRSRIMGLDAPIKISAAVEAEQEEFLEFLRTSADPETYERVLAIYAAKGRSEEARGASAREGTQSTH